MNKSRFPQIGGYVGICVDAEFLCLIHIYGHKRKVNILYLSILLADLVS